MSSLRISSIARITRCERSGSGSMSSSPSTVGTICHDTPNRSSSQPHSPCVPPSDRDSHRPSTSSWVSQFTTNEIAGVNANSGPPFSATNSCPSSRKSIVITVPAGPGPASPYRETPRILDSPPSPARARRAENAET